MVYTFLKLILAISEVISDGKKYVNRYNLQVNTIPMKKIAAENTSLYSVSQVSVRCVTAKVPLTAPEEM